MSDTQRVHCYNKGCLKEFLLSENKATSCVHHPGEPYFHDAYKEWTCCKKRSVDFTEFLNYKGCATSFHNPNKPAEKEKPAKPIDVIEPVEISPSKPKEAMIRPDEKESMMKLN